MNKKWLVGCLIGAVVGVGGCAGLMALLCGGVFVATQPVVDVSNRFLKELGDGHSEAAYQMTSDGYRAEQDIVSFNTITHRLSLDEFESASWASRSIVNNEGKVEGQVQTRSGKSYQTAMELVKENGVWKIAKVKVSDIEMHAYKIPKIPGTEDLRLLAKTTFLEVNKSIRANDFTSLHTYISEYWRKQTSAEALAKALSGFVQNRIDISIVATLTPTFDPAPTINEDDFLVLSGKYVNGDGRLVFKLKYIQEGGVWKLAGFDMKTGKDAESR